MACYLAIEKNGELIPAKTWKNIINIMLSERCQSQKTTHFMTPFI